MSYLCRSDNSVFRGLHVSTSRSLFPWSGTLCCLLAVADSSAEHEAILKRLVPENVWIVHTTHIKWEWVWLWVGSVQESWGSKIFDSRTGSLCSFSLFFPLSHSRHTLFHCSIICTAWCRFNATTQRVTPGYCGPTSRSPGVASQPFPSTTWSTCVAVWLNPSSATTPYKTTGCTWFTPLANW